MTTTWAIRSRIDDADRRLLAAWCLRIDSPPTARRAWIGITHSGGAAATIAAVVLPLLIAPWPRAATLQVALALVVSHLVVQALKRAAGRNRPDIAALIRCPDCYSFPSGHATAALAVALGYGVAFPSAGIVLLPFGLLVGWSRVILGVHYPGDVVIGQVIAAASVAGVHLIG